MSVLHPFVHFFFFKGNVKVLVKILPDAGYVPLSSLLLNLLQVC